MKAVLAFLPSLAHYVLYVVYAAWKADSVLSSYNYKFWSSLQEIPPSYPSVGDTETRKNDKIHIKI